MAAADSLFQVYQGTVRRVQPAAVSLRACASFILKSPKKRFVATWIGSRAMRVDTALAKKMANVMSRDEVRAVAGTHAVWIEQGVALGDDETEDKFWTGIGVLNSEIARHLTFGDDEISPALENQNRPSVLLEAYLESSPGDDGGVQQLRFEEIERSEVDQQNGTVTFLHSGHLTTKETGVFVLDCEAELFVWSGRGADAMLKKKAREWCDSERAAAGRPDYCAVSVVRAKAELAVFRELFEGWDDVVPAIPTKAKKAVAMQSVAEQVEIMHSPLVGSLLCAAEGVGDPSRTGLKLKLAEDDSGVLRKFHLEREVQDSGSRASRKLAADKVEHRLVEVPPDMLGRFLSTECYVVVYNCKVGTKTVVYSWVGCEAPPDSRAALGFRVRDIGARQGELGPLFKLNSAVDQIQIEQFAEPPLFKDLFVLRGIDVIIERDDFTSPAMNRRNTRVFEVGGEHHGSAVAVELADPRQAAALGLDQRHSYVILTRGESTRCWHGNASGDPQRETARRLAGACDSTNLCVSHARRADEDGREEVSFVDATAGGEPAGFFLALRCGPSAGSNEGGADVNMPPPPPPDNNVPARSRPVRLFEVSQSRRSVGAMFVEEVGSGVFRQHDLKHHECYILDAGANELFVWYGPDATNEGRTLVNEVALAYSAADRAPAGSPIAASLARGVRPVDVESGYEPFGFAGCFTGWDSAMQRTKDPGASVRPATVGTASASFENASSEGVVASPGGTLRLTSAKLVQQKNLHEGTAAGQYDGAWRNLGDRNRPASLMKCDGIASRLGKLWEKGGSAVDEAAAAEAPIATSPRSRILSNASAAEAATAEQQQPPTAPAAPANYSWRPGMAPLDGAATTVVASSAATKTTPPPAASTFNRVMGGARQRRCSSSMGKPPMLFRVYQGHLQRVELATDSLNAKGSFILRHDASRQVMVWSGASAKRADVFTAQDLARHMRTDEMRGGGASGAGSGGVPSFRQGDEPAEFWGLIRSGNDFAQQQHDTDPVPSNDDVTNDAPKLLQLTSDGGEGAASLSPTELASASCNSRGIVTKLSADGIKTSDDGVFVLDCGLELYLYYGRRTALATKKAAKAWCDAQAGGRDESGGCGVTECKPRMEPVRFKAYFASWS